MFWSNWLTGTTWLFEDLQLKWKYRNFLPAVLVLLSPLKVLNKNFWFFCNRLDSLEEKHIIPHQKSTEANKWQELLNRDQQFVAYDSTRVILKTCDEGIIFKILSTTVVPKTKIDILNLILLQKVIDSLSINLELISFESSMQI